MAVMKKPLFAGILMLGLLHAERGLALDVVDFSTEKNDRFKNDPTFIMSNYDLSGVGRGSNNTYATLVSRNVFVSADHFNFHPSVNGTVTFYKTNDPNGPSITRTVVSGQVIPGSDTWVGVLDEPVPVGYAVYEFATENITNDGEFTLSPYHDKNAYMLGQSPNYSGLLDIAVGKNVVDDWSNSTPDGLLTTMDGDIDFEAELVAGDSGAPLFVDMNEGDTDYTLRLLATNWFVGSVNGNNINGFTYLGNYDAQIQAIIDANPIPEPGTAIALCIAGTILTRRRRRD